MWVIAVVGDAPCQCFSPGGIQMTSPGRISSIGPPHRCARPAPDTHDQRLTERMRVPRRPSPRLKRDARAVDTRRRRRVQQRIDPYGSGEPLRRALCARPGTNPDDVHDFSCFGGLCPYAGRPRPREERGKACERRKPHPVAAVFIDCGRRHAHPAQLLEVARAARCSLLGNVLSHAGVFCASAVVAADISPLAGQQSGEIPSRTVAAVAPAVLVAHGCSIALIARRSSIAA